MVLIRKSEYIAFCCASLLLFCLNYDSSDLMMDYDSVSSCPFGKLA